MNMFRLGIAVILAVAFLSYGVPGARAEEVDLNVACRTAGDLERFGTIAEKILSDETIDVNTGYALAVSQDGLGASCVLTGVDSFDFQQVLADNPEMSDVIYTDESGVKTSLIGYTPVDEDTPVVVDATPASASPDSTILSHRGEKTCSTRVVVATDVRQYTIVGPCD